MSDKRSNQKIKFFPSSAIIGTNTNSHNLYLEIKSRRDLIKVSFKVFFSFNALFLLYRSNFCKFIFLYV